MIQKKSCYIKTKTLNMIEKNNHTVQHFILHMQTQPIIGLFKRLWYFETIHASETSDKGVDLLWKPFHLS